MNADEHRFDWLTERVFGAIFEVTNTRAAQKRVAVFAAIYGAATVRESALYGLFQQPARLEGA